MDYTSLIITLFHETFWFLFWITFADHLFLGGKITSAFASRLTKDSPKLKKEILNLKEEIKELELEIKNLKEENEIKENNEVKIDDM